MDHERRTIRASAAPLKPERRVRDHPGVGSTVLVAAGGVAAAAA
jgi:hypothetical protein